MLCLLAYRSVFFVFFFSLLSLYILFSAFSAVHFLYDIGKAFAVFVKLKNT